MGDAFLYGNGGSNILNLKVVGGTSAPASPKENTIWVNTDAAITDWIFNTSTPTTRCDGSALSGGEVYFKCGVEAPVPINILKKNGALEYPNKCYQYISGSWVLKTAKTYQDGTWKSWSVYLYNRGFNNTSVGGGMTQSGWAWSGNGSNGTAAYASDCIVFSGSSGAATRHIFCGSASSINLTGKSTAKIVYQVLLDLISPRSGFFICPAQDIGTYSGVVWFTVASGEHTGTIDISALSGSYYVGVGMCTDTAGTRGYVYEISFQ